jgi:hypothetical protein
MPLEQLGNQKPSGRVTDPAEARANLRAWILTKNDDVAPEVVSDQTKLLAAGLLRSIHVPELILMLERWRGEPLDVANLGPGDFDDVETIVSRFVIGHQPGARS